MGTKTWQEILLPTIEEAYSNQFGLAQDNTAANFVVTGEFTGEEKAILQQYNQADESWTDVRFMGVNIILDATTNSISVNDDWGTYRWHKDVTTSPVGIVIQAANASDFLGE